MSYDDYKLSNGINEQKETDFNNWLDNTEAQELCEAVHYPINELCTENRISQDDDDAIEEVLQDSHLIELQEYFEDN